MFAFLFVDLFDTLGTLIGVASKADMLDKDGKLPRIKGALMADAVATVSYTHLDVYKRQIIVFTLQRKIWISLHGKGFI